jgi:hypothetical protein
VSTTDIVKPSQASVARQGFGTQEIEIRRETQGSALAARAQAEVQARYIVAMQRPRNYDDVRIRLLGHCKRIGFAERAEYSKPVGGSSVKGPSIRFVETALQEYGNVEPDSYVTYEDEDRRIYRVTMTDLERNITYHEDAVIEKVIDRTSPKRGDVVLGQRENSRGGTTYRIKANNGDAELENRYAAEISKRTRKLGLRILPIDLVDEGIGMCRDTIKNGDQDPATTRKRITDAFAEVGVMPRDLDLYLGHPLASSSPAELDDLRTVYRAVKDGESTWAELMEVRETGDQPAAERKPPADDIKAKLADKLDKARKE